MKTFKRGGGVDAKNSKNAVVRGKVRGNILIIRWMLQTSQNYVYNILLKREEQIADILTSGGVQNFEQYQQLVGEVQGLVYAKEEIKALLEKNIDDAEDIIRS